MAEMSVGKLVNLRRLADDQGRFKTLAIDQRGSLQNALARIKGVETGQPVLLDQLLRHLPGLGDALQASLPAQDLHSLKQGR